MAMTDGQLMADLLASFPSIHARPAREYGCSEYQEGVWVGGEADIGGLPIFSTLSCNDPDDYNGDVLHGFEAWLEARGYALECWDAGVYFAVASNRSLDLASASQEER